ncbi:hypothetical protein GF337_06335 [candidate division KSB1 bacterium]|nr:hypothetical protein [candidate division KSB1 bacterium]
MKKSPQELIEKFMRDVIGQGNYEMAYLFSEEGLPMAEVRGEGLIPEDRLVEISMIFQEIIKMADVMGGIDQLNEVIIEGHNRRKIIFRFFKGFDQSLILALVIPPRKTYRGLTNKLVRIIQQMA